MPCDFPVALKPDVHIHFGIRPCGKCTGCRIDYSRAKAIRSMHEIRYWPASSFVTLTYNKDNLIYNKNGIAPTVTRRDLQLFFKSLRRKLEPQKIAYMASAEYGEQHARPHYHAILFGEDFKFDREPWEQEGLFTSPTLSNAWGNKGNAIIGDVAYDSVAYVASYTVKKLNGEMAVSEYDDLGRTRPFGAMSSKPAIGRRFIEDYLYDVYPRDTVLINGVEVRPPRYYDDYLKVKDPDLYDRVMHKRAKKSEQRAENCIVNDGASRSYCLTNKLAKKSAKL